ncbi:hypothetical protein BD626DRAFT_485825 [Schizophyllum amplum]|uniref:Uncharacterized protein n=1 Tax=Schizophyllum amplum TaxID=97359 RepID=A0A550CLV2_9AGAR|nr:hypothetical protein BD626DRAFT_485825 [Auriculariopsis ampla]
MLRQRASVGASGKRTWRRPYKLTANHRIYLVAGHWLNRKQMHELNALRRRRVALHDYLDRLARRSNAPVRNGKTPLPATQSTQLGTLDVDVASEETLQALENFDATLLLPDWVKENDRRKCRVGTMTLSNMEHLLRMDALEVQRQADESRRAVS